jgi:hypothetical protein
MVINKLNTWISPTLSPKLNRLLKLFIPLEGKLSCWKQVNLAYRESNESQNYFTLKPTHTRFLIKKECGT